MGDPWFPSFKLVMKANSTRELPLPVFGERKKLKIALREMVLTGFPIVEDETEFAHVCISPPVNLKTHLPNNRSLSCIKTFTIDGARIHKNFSQELDFFHINTADQMNRFGQSVLGVEVKDNNACTLVVSGVLIFDLHPI